MAKKLYHVGFDTINQFTSKNRQQIKELIHQKERLELSKVFGRAYFEMAIESFMKKFKIDKDARYALHVLNHLKSNAFIQDLYAKLQLSAFEEKSHRTNSISFGDYEKSLFYGFVYFLYTNETQAKQSVKEKLFILYFFHSISSANNPSNIKIEYKDMALSYIKGRDIDLRESYKLDEENKKVTFKIVINKKTVVQLEGKSVKTLRKRAFKKAFFYLIDKNYTPILPV